MLADIHILHRSDVYQVVDFKCHCNICSLSEPEYNESFCMGFIRKGFFEYRTFRRNNEVHVGRILLSRPGFEHTTRHIDDQPDISTIFEFKDSFIKEIETEYKKDIGWFLLNKDIHSILLQSDPETEYMHHQILESLTNGQANSLQVDEMVFQLLDQVIRIAGNKNEIHPVPENLKKFHLTTVELAKEYLLEHFRKNISLQKLAEHCHVSPFHFSRIFKSVLKTSPHQYLTGIRLKHAKLLLSSTAKPVTDIAFECGFNSIEHFATTYRQRFGVSPREFRKEFIG